METNRSQGHHHHHGEGHREEGSFINRLAQSIVGDLQQSANNGTDTGSGPSAAVLGPTTGSFLDRTASAIATDLFGLSQQASDSTEAPSSSSATDPVAASGTQWVHTDPHLSNEFGDPSSSGTTSQVTTIGTNGAAVMPPSTNPTSQVNIVA